MFLARFETLEKDLIKEKSNLGKTCKKLEQERMNNISLHIELKALKVKNYDLQAANNNLHQLQLENESLKKNLSSVVNLLLNDRFL